MFFNAMVQFCYVTCKGRLPVNGCGYLSYYTITRALPQYAHAKYFAGKYFAGKYFPQENA
jgi:hypothetical protein